nr:RNA-directed DNA polymerase, eukaryota, reverse transcriptase zinc-binding domain protein [Tanacetum cinerariifolium]
MENYRTNEDDVAKISTYIFVTSFPESFFAKYLFQSCKQYGHVVDTFILNKRSKDDKRFGFVRFINVFNDERLVNNLCMIWNDRLKLHANIARFNRAPLKENNIVRRRGMSGKMECGSIPAMILDDECLFSKDVTNSLMGWVMLEFASCKLKDLFRSNVGVGSWFSVLEQAEYDFTVEGRIVWVEVEVSKLHSVGGDTVMHEVGNHEEDNDVDEVLKTMFDESSGQKKKQSEDPFGIYPLLDKQRKLIHMVIRPCPKGQKDWVKELCVSNKVNFLTLQETKMKSMKLITIKSCWGNYAYDYVHSDAVRNSGGILCVWDTNEFCKTNCTISDYFVTVQGVWVKTGANLLIVAVYAPQDLKDTSLLWDYLTHVSNHWDEEAELIWLKGELHATDGDIDNGNGSDEVVSKRKEIINLMLRLNKIKASEAAQKAKIKWFVEGDENSSFFHGMLNKNRNQLSIQGVMADGVWIENPDLVKDEFVQHFSSRFGKPTDIRASINMNFPKVLSIVQKEELECDVSKEELKQAVWDCGMDKSPGPDGFTFVFFRKFWLTIENDVYEDVTYFFTNRVIPRGCNSSLIALTPKTPGANMENFDGSFILNEVTHWCTVKKKQALIFKVDFEKAYDSVRWNFLDEVLQKFGFCNKWCMWIQSSLRSSRGSILVNGSPTEEFQFYKGLNQGDPISPFLFILIMESLHLSFQMVVDVGMFTGINLSPSVNLSHMFYADDAVFIGHWNDSNINTLVNVLECFYHASGLRINMCKSKIMGVHVEGDLVKHAASKLGCLILNTLFVYLGTKVGGKISRVKEWNEVVDKVVSRLSKWKIKTLSIGGRLTLLKWVLGSIPIFHMSIYRVPLRVLQQLESIRNRFFNGNDLGSKKATSIKWSNMLADKVKGGLGVCSLYALNRGLMIKWLLRFYAQNTSLWVRVVKAIHGEDGKVGQNISSRSYSCWLNIVKEVSLLQAKGVNVMNYVRLKLGNRESTSFWKDNWINGGVLKDAFPRLYALEMCKKVYGGWSCAYVGSLEGSGDFSVASIKKVIDDKFLLNVSSKLDGSNMCLSRQIACKVSSWWNVDYVDVNSYEEWLDWLGSLRLLAKLKLMLEGVFYM